MKAFILAAGRGERMRPLTDQIPKPLLTVAGKPLIVHLIEQLRAEGFIELVINTAYLGAQIHAALGDGAALGVSIRYSDEGPEPLETLGGIVHALPLLGAEPFLVINADIALDYPLGQLALPDGDDAHLLLIANPPHHPDGDFGLNEQGRVLASAARQFTFAGVGVYHSRLFHNLTSSKAKLAPLLRQAMSQNRVSGTLHHGFWLDVGTPDRLQALAHYLPGNCHARS
ncbi:MAG: nucleotidyltransferase family protein [Methylococcales bacterium]|nr:nucleotidyltransferase family protein [Methylococcales bacterium]